MKQLIMSFLVLGLIGMYSCSSSGTDIVQLKPAELEQTLSKTPTTILDVRTAEELSEGVIDAKRDLGIRAEFVHVDFKGTGMDIVLDRLDKDKPIVAYCAGGVRSGKTCKLLQEKGFKSIYNLEGGFTAYQEWKTK